MKNVVRLALASTLFSALASTFLFSSSTAFAVNRPTWDAYLSARPAPVSPTSARLAPAAVTSYDEQRGLPQFLWATSTEPPAPLTDRATPENAARWYLARHAARYRMSQPALATMVLDFVHDTGRGGIIAVFHQQVDGVDVMVDTVKVLMKRDLELVAISGHLNPSAVAGLSLKGRAFQLKSDRALSTAFHDLYGVSAPPSAFQDNGRRKAGYRYYELSNTPSVTSAGLELSQPARIKQVFYPMPDRLEPAYYLELQSQRVGDVSADVYAYVIAAADGRVLRRQNLTADAFNYRVWAYNGGDKRALQGPQSDFSPNPTGKPDGTQPSFIAPDLVSMDGFNTNPGGVNDPWLAAAATESNGNNIDAYVDLTNPDGLSDGDFRASVTSPGTFDRTFDTSADPIGTKEQSMAALVQMFYVTNWMHDWYYDSGFNEQAGNAQMSNLGRGGIEGDPIHAEGQDGALEGSLNNANMSTPADGSSPRMQMFLFSGELFKKLEVPSTNTTLASNTAAFGPEEFDLTNTIVVANDGVDPTSDGCSKITNNVRGKIALIDRGTCSFQIKASYAQAAGAVGVIIANNVLEEGALAMGASKNVVPVSIPAMSTDYNGGVYLKTQAATVKVHMSRANGVERDGTIDNTVISHEWGHYLHHRLVQTCTSQQCGAMSEGWGDTNSMIASVLEGDDLSGSYAIAIYAAVGLVDNVGYFGLRRTPYSTDFDKDPLTFRHIQRDEPLPTNAPIINLGDNSEVHNAGEVWSAMTWEANAAMLAESQGPGARFTFDQAHRRITDYIVAGMIMAPANPTFTEQRDGILAAASAVDPEDFQVIADAFARRGVGTCAVSPPRDSTDLVGVVESYEVGPNLELGEVTLDDSLSSCDGDGALDAGETGRVSVEILNTGVATLAGAKATLSTTAAGVTFPEGTSISFDPIERYGTATASVAVQLDPSMVGMGFLDLKLAVNNPSACTPTVTETRTFRVNYDDLLASSATDTVESEAVLWTELDAEGGGNVWERSEATSTNHVYHGADPSSLADASWVSPDIQVTTASSFSIVFSHRYEFETGSVIDGGQILYFDGGVIEVSTDNGAKWTDISKYADPGYNGTIGGLAPSNPLYGKTGYVDHNKSWPNMDTVTLNLGTTFSGKTLKLRFRIGADSGGGAGGWEVDNIAFKGTSNKPFSSVVDNAAVTTGYYPDADGDGYGAAGQPLVTCQAPAGYVDVGGDCNDSDEDIHPATQEVCNGLDDNCDGAVDEKATDGTTWYVDEDGDGHGTPGETTTACDAPDGFAESDDDCDDGDADTFPEAPELCDGLDNDCDGVTDNDPTNAATFYTDVDGDGYGVDVNPVTACEAPAGYATASGDCDDLEASSYPGAPEDGRDGIDHNCDGRVDNASSPTPTPGGNQGDDDASSDTTPGTGGDDSSSGCSCSQPGSSPARPGLMPALTLVAAAGLLRRRGRSGRK